LRSLPDVIKRHLSFPVIWEDRLVLPFYMAADVLNAAQNVSVGT